MGGVSSHRLGRGPAGPALLGRFLRRRRIRLVATHRLTPGARLARDVWRGLPGQIPLLAAGSRVTPEYRDALVRGGIHAVYVDDELGAGMSVPEVLSETTRRTVTTVVAGALATGGFAVDERSALPGSALVDLGRAVTLIVDDVLHAPDDTLLLLSDLASADAYTVQHLDRRGGARGLARERLFRQRVDDRGRPIVGRDRLRARLGRLGLGCCSTTWESSPFRPRS